MALNKSGLPPQKNPMSAAVRPGGPGTVSPKKAAAGGGDGAFGIGALKGPKMPPLGGSTIIGKGVPAPKFAKGGGVPTIPKLPKIPRFK
jgi:hypothetical protein